MAPRMPDWQDVRQGPAPETGAVVRAPDNAIPGAVARLGETFLNEEKANKAEADRRLQVNENVAAGRLKVKRQEQAERDSLELSAARTDWAKRRLNEEALYQQDQNPDFNKWGGAYAKNIGKHKSASASLISDPKLRAKFEMEQDVDITEGSLRLKNRVDDLIRGDRRAAGLNSIEDSLNLATTPGLPPEEVDKIFAATRKNIDNMVISGVLTPEQAVEARRKFSERYASAKVKADIQNDPEGAYRHLQGGAVGEVYYSKLGGKESGHNYNATNDDSSAGGKYQILKGTWADIMKAHPELGLTKDGRFNRSQQERAIRAFTTDNAKALQNAGFNASEANLYLAHFLGAGGAVTALKAPPGAIAAELLPDAAKSNPTIFFAGKGENMRPRTIAEVIALQTKGFSGQDGPAPTYYQFLPPEERASFTAAAESEYASRVKVERENDALAKYQLKSTLEDDITQIRETGKPSDVDINAIRTTLGDDDLAKWLDDRRAAAATYKAVTAMDTMTNDEIDEHVLASEPDAGDPHFKDAQATYDAVEKRAKKIKDLRLNDPAKSVEESGPVRAALKAVNPDDPRTIQSLVKARIGAQEQVGIPTSMRQPVTRAEARQIIAPIQNILDMTEGQMVAAVGSSGGDKAKRKATIAQVKRESEDLIRQTVDQIEQTYGPYAPQVLAFSIAESVRDKEIGNLASGVLRKIANREPVTIGDVTGIETAKDAATAEQAMGGTLPKPQGSPQTAAAPPGSNAPAQPAEAAPASSAAPARTVQPTSGRRANEGGADRPKPKGPQQKPGKPWPSAKDVRTLIANPGAAAEFDKVYGQGAAAEWLPKE